MKFINHLIGNQSRSAQIRFLSPIITFLILGLTSGSFGYYIAVNKTFFQDSKADARIRLPKINIEPPNKFVKDLVTNLPVDEKIQPLAKEVLSKATKVQIIQQTKVIPKRFDAITLVDYVPAYRVPSRQAYENPSTIGKIHTLTKNQPYDVTGVLETRDGKWLELKVPDIDEPVFVKAKYVFCNVPAICFDQWKAVKEDSSLIDSYKDYIVNQGELQVGW